MLNIEGFGMIKLSLNSRITMIRKKKEDSSRPSYCDLTGNKRTICGRSHEIPPTQVKQTHKVKATSILVSLLTHFFFI